MLLFSFMIRLILFKIKLFIKSPQNLFYSRPNNPSKYDQLMIAVKALYSLIFSGPVEPVERQWSIEMNLQFSKKFETYAKMVPLNGWTVDLRHVCVCDVPHLNTKRVAANQNKTIGSCSGDLSVFRKRFSLRIENCYVLRLRRVFVMRVKGLSKWLLCICVLSKAAG